MKPADKSDSGDEAIDIASAWIVFRRRLRRLLLARSRRELRRSTTPSLRIAVDETFLLPSATHESRD